MILYSKKQLVPKCMYVTIILFRDDDIIFKFIVKLNL